MREETARLRAQLLVTPVEGRAAVVAALERTGGNATRAARLLGVPKRTFDRILHDAGIAAELERIRTKAKETPNDDEAG